VWTRTPVAHASAARITELLRPLLGGRAGSLEQLSIGAFGDQLALVGPPDLVAFVIDNMRLLDAPEAQPR
jgi:hypothetical protein